MEDEVYNCKNSRVIAEDFSCVNPVMQIKYPAIISKGKAMPPHYFEADLNINTSESLMNLEKFSYTMIP